MDYIIKYRDAKITKTDHKKDNINTTIYIYNVKYGDELKKLHGCTLPNGFNSSNQERLISYLEKKGNKKLGVEEKNIIRRHCNDELFIAINYGIKLEDINEDN